MANMGKDTSLRKDRDEWRARARSAEGTLKRRDVEGANLLERLDTACAERGAFQKALKTRGEERNQLAKARNSWKKKYDEAVAAAAGYHKQTTDLAGQHALAVAQVVQQKANVEALQMTILEKDKQISGLEAIRPAVVLQPWSVQIENLNRTAEAAALRYKSNIDTLKSQLKDALEDCEDYDVRTGQLQSRIMELEKENFELKGAHKCKIEDLQARCVDWRARRDRVMRQRDSYYKALGNERKLSATRLRVIERVKKDNKDVKAMWRQTLDSRAILWDAIEKSGKKKLIKALDEAYIDKWNGGATVAVLSELAEDMYRALCPECNQHENDISIWPVQKKGEKWVHQVKHRYGSSLRFCSASPLRRFMERYK